MSATRSAPAGAREIVEHVQLRSEIPHGSARRTDDAFEGTEYRRQAEVDEIDVGNPEHEVSAEDDPLREDVVDDVE
jgi:hypothetical protein